MIKDVLYHYNIFYYVYYCENLNIHIEVYDKIINKNCNLT